MANTNYKIGYARENSFSKQLSKFIEKLLLKIALKDRLVMSSFSSSISDSVQPFYVRNQNKALLNNIFTAIRNVPIVINIEEDNDSKNVLFYPALRSNDELRNLLEIVLEKDEVDKFIKEFREIRGENTLCDKNLCNKLLVAYSTVNGQPINGLFEDEKGSTEPFERRLRDNFRKKISNNKNKEILMGNFIRSIRDIVGCEEEKVKNLDKLYDELKKIFTDDFDGLLKIYLNSTEKYLKDNNITSNNMQLKLGLKQDIWTFLTNVKKNIIPEYKRNLSNSMAKR